MGAWAYGLFENDTDQDLICGFNEDAGLKELQKAADVKFEKEQQKKKPSKKQAGFKAKEDCRPYYTMQGGGSAPEEIRKHLESGVLEKMFAKQQQEMIKQTDNFMFEPDYTFCLLGACAMTLGCSIPYRYKVQIQKLFLHVGFLEAAERQLSKALNGPDGYQEGVPYHFEVPADVVAFHNAEMAARKAKGIVLINVPAPFGLSPAPLPKNKVLRNTMDEGKYGPAACGGCGAKKKQYGEALLRCGKCKEREYCGAKCQKEHWKLHKKVCKPVGDDK